MGVGDLCYRTSAITLRIVRKTSTTIPGHSISYVFRTIPPTRPFTILSMKPKFSLGNSTGTACSAAQQQNQHKGVSRILVSTANIQKGEKEKSITSNLLWDLIFSGGKLKELRLPVRPPSWIFKPLKIGGNRLFSWHPPPWLHSLFSLFSFSLPEIVVTATLSRCWSPNAPAP